MLGLALEWVGLGTRPLLGQIQRDVDFINARDLCSAIHEWDCDQDLGVRLRKSCDVKECRHPFADWPKCDVSSFSKCSPSTENTRF